MQRSSLTFTNPPYVNQLQVNRNHTYEVNNTQHIRTATANTNAVSMNALHSRQAD